MYSFLGQQLISSCFCALAFIALADGKGPSVENIIIPHYELVSTSLVSQIKPIYHISRSLQDCKKICPYLWCSDWKTFSLTMLIPNYNCLYFLENGPKSQGSLRNKNFGYFVKFWATIPDKKISVTCVTPLIVAREKLFSWICRHARAGESSRDFMRLFQRS